MHVIITSEFLIIFFFACTVIFWNSFFREATSYYLFGDVVTTDNDALDPGSQVLVLMQGTTQNWKVFFFFFSPQFFSESSLGTANEAGTVDGPSGLEVEDSAGCFFLSFLGGGTMPFNTAAYSGPVVKPADNLHI